MKMNRLQQKLFLVFLLVFLISSCSSQELLMSVKRPAQTNVPKTLKQVVILQNKIDSTNDQLSMKKEILQDLKQQLTIFKQYKVTIGMPKSFDINQADIAVIEGSVTSRLQIEKGQFTNLATCSFGVGGAGQAATNKEQNPDITISNRGGICYSRDARSALISNVADTLFEGLTDYIPDLTEVYRVKTYKNTSYFVQTNFTFTYINKNTRKMLASRIGTASFGFQDKKPPINVHESSVSIPEILPLLFVPVSPLYIRSVAIAKETKYDYYKNINISAHSLDVKKEKQIRKQLAMQSIANFVYAISPYQEKIVVHNDSNGNAKAVKLLEKQKWEEAKKILQNLPNKNEADLYNLGLSFEATAVSIDDYMTAQIYYKQAFSKDDDNELYATALARIERRLWQLKK